MNVLSRNGLRLYKSLILASTVYLLLSGRPALACDCAGPRGKAALVNAKVAFSGKVTRIRYLDSPEQIGREPRIIVTFQVYQVWKGRPKKTIVVHTVLNKWTCNGYWFEQGEEYLVFAHANDPIEAKRFSKARNTLGVGTCSGTLKLAAAEKDVKELGTGKVPR